MESTWYVFTTNGRGSSHLVRENITEPEAREIEEQLKRLIPVGSYTQRKGFPRSVRAMYKGRSIGVFNEKDAPYR